MLRFKFGNIGTVSFSIVDCEYGYCIVDFVGLSKFLDYRPVLWYLLIPGKISNSSVNFNQQTLVVKERLIMHAHMTRAIINIKF